MFQENMKFVNNVRVFVFFTLYTVSLVMFSCEKKQEVVDISDLCVEYKLIHQFSERIEPKTGLVLFSYGINSELPKGYQFIHGVGDFSAYYIVHKTRSDVISLEEVRRLLVSVAEGLLKEINSDPNVRPNLDAYPFTSDLLTIDIIFEDENGIELGNSEVSRVFFSHGKINYERYEIYEYTNRIDLPEGIYVHEEVNGKLSSRKIAPHPPAGKYFTVLDESYADALEIVKRQNGLMQL